MLGIDVTPIAIRAGARGSAPARRQTRPPGVKTPNICRLEKPRARGLRVALAQLDRIAVGVEHPDLTAKAAPVLFLKLRAHRVAVEKRHAHFLERGLGRIEILDFDRDMRTGRIGTVVLL